MSAAITFRNLVQLMDNSELIQRFEAEVERAKALNQSPSWSLQGDREVCRKNIEILKAEIAARTQHNDKERNNGS